MIKDFRTLQLAKSLYLQCKSLSLKGAVRDQLERATLSICLNLAEGSGKTSVKDQTRFYQIAMGSLRETQVILDILSQEKEIKLADQIGAGLWCLIRSQKARQ